MLSRMRRDDGTPGVHVRLAALLVVLGLALVAAPALIPVVNWFLDAVL